VVETGPDCFAVDVSAETLSRTTLGDWRPGDPINLELSLCLGDELGGHLVSGHVDATAEILERRPEGDSQRFVFRAPAEVAPFIASKGSIALDGVSLTINEVEDQPDGEVRFGVNIIPHTAENTSFGSAHPGQRVNLEIDLLARYVQRQLGRQD
jgi:riboflavin synthase